MRLWPWLQRWVLVAALVARPAFAEAKIFTISIVPLGPVDQEDLDTVAQALRDRLKVEVRFEPALPMPEAAYYPPRKRYRAEKLLDALEAQGPQGAWKIVGVTNSDISTTKGKVFDWGIAGLGLLGGRTCVLSTFLYKKYSKTKAVMLRRLADITVHEFGHTLGMPHCAVKGCVMSDANGKAISSADQSTGQYCETCRRLAEWGPLILKGSALAGNDGGQGPPGSALQPRVASDGGQ